MNNTGEWKRAYTGAREVVLGDVVLGYEKKFKSGAHTTFLERLRALFYVGFRYGIFSDTHTNNRLTVWDEACFSWAVVQAMKQPDEWQICRHYAFHSPSGLRIWIANGASFLHAEEPQRLALRTRSQRRIMRGARRLRKLQKRGTFIRALTASLERPR